MNDMEEYNRNPENRPMSGTTTDNKAHSKEDTEQYGNKLKEDWENAEQKDEQSEQSGEKRPIPATRKG